ncbi:MAG TPA: hypothetical protein VEI97_09935, partial [bacterium]|nr:hypothetical protein [bacterium]
FDTSKRRLEFRWDDHRLIRPYTIRQGLQLNGRPMTAEPWGWSVTASSAPGPLLELLEAAATVFQQGSRIAISAYATESLVSDLDED